MRPGVARRRLAIPALAAVLCLIGGPLRAQESEAVQAQGMAADSAITGALPADSLESFLRAYIGEHLGRIEASFASGEEDFQELRRRRDSVSPTEIGPLEPDISAVRAWGDTLWRYEEWTLSAGASLGLDVADRWARYDRNLSAAVESEVGRLQIAVAGRDRLADGWPDSGSPTWS
jgi:hypothetical protein